MGKSPTAHEQTIDAFDPNAPCSSNQNLKVFSLATNDSENTNIPDMDMFSSDEEDTSINDQYEIDPPHDDTSESHYNHDLNNVSHVQVPENDSPKDVKQPKPGTSSGNNVDNRRVTPLKLNLQEIVKAQKQKQFTLQASKKAQKQKQKIDIPNGSVPKKPRKERKKVKCKTCGMVVPFASDKQFLKHYIPHVGDEVQGGVEPVHNVDGSNMEFWKCPCDGCQFSSRKRHVVDTHILSDHFLEQLLTNEGVSSIAELYDIFNPPQQNDNVGV